MAEMHHYLEISKTTPLSHHSPPRMFQRITKSSLATVATLMLIPGAKSKEIKHFQLNIVDFSFFHTIMCYKFIWLAQSNKQHFESLMI